MSTVPPVPPPNDPVARATDALRRAPVPDGPPPETVARTLAALRAAAEEPGHDPRPRRRIVFAMLKTAAAIATAAAGVSYFAALPPASATTEFVEAARKLQEARTLSFRQTITTAGIPTPMAGRTLYKVPGLVRFEPDRAPEGITVMDLIRGKVLLLMPADRSAMQLDVPPAGASGTARRGDPSAAMIEDMRQLAQKNGEPAGERLIGGVRARGFRVKEKGEDMTVWVDPEKRLPLLVEFSARIGTLEYHGAFSEIRLDPELDDALFRLEPPAGYSLRKMRAKFDMTPEQAVARHLRSYAEASGGRFPARLDDFADWQKVVGEAARKKAPADAKAREGKGLLDALKPEVFEAAVASGRVAVICQQMKDRYGYKADGVRLGDAKTLIFWYKPEGQEKYKAVYGDLHIGEVSAAELPK